MNTLGQIIKAKQQRQRDLATLCEVSESTMSKWCNRVAGIPVRALVPLADALGVSVLEIIRVAEPVSSSDGSMVS